MDNYDILSMTLTELEYFITEIVGEPKYRAAQVYAWLHKKNAASFAEMTNLSKPLREKLENMVSIYGCTILKEETANDKSVKYINLVKNGVVESVYIPRGYGACLCVSSQLGCGFGCAFCASGSGFKGNLTAGEMLSQVYTAEAKTGALSNIVVMGMGEPLDNYEALIKFLNIINAENGRNLSVRSITISTCGISPAIRRLAADKPGVGLAISLHAPDNELRKKLMPRAGNTSIASLVSAADYFFETTGRRVTWEYLLLNGINDNPEHSSALVKLFKGKNTHINLLRYNANGNKRFSASRREKEFLAELTQKGINATLRKSLGQDVKGACGQLAGECEKRSKGTPQKVTKPRKVIE